MCKCACVPFIFARLSVICINEHQLFFAMRFDIFDVSAYTYEISSNPAVLEWCGMVFANVDGGSLARSYESVCVSRRGAERKN